MNTENRLYNALTDESHLEKLATNMGYVKLPIPTPETPVELGDFVVKEVLGHQGNTSITCRAVAIRDGLKYKGGIEYVVKGPVEKPTQRQTMSALRMFINEMRIFSMLKQPGKHNIASLVGYNDHLADGPLYMVFQEIPHQTMREKSDDKRIDPVILLPMLDGIATALVYLHRNKIVHGDLKDDNVRLSRDGRPILLDLGAAFRKDDGSRFRDYWSPHFSPPEFHRYYWAKRHGEQADNPKDPKHDVFSLGVLAYKLLTGDRLYSKLIGPRDTADLMAIVEHASAGMTPVREELLDPARYAPNIRRDIQFMRGWIKTLTEPDKQKRPSMFDAHLQLIEHLGRDRRLSTQVRRISERREKAKAEKESSGQLRTRTDMMRELQEFELKQAAERHQTRVQEPMLSFSESEDPAVAALMAAKKGLEGEATDALNFN